MNVDTKILFTWSDKYELGIPLIDSQHIKLFEIINMLLEGVNKGEADSILEEIVEELVMYAKVHFAAEEELMEKCNYNNIIDHKYKHKDFFSKIESYRKEMKNEPIKVAYQLKSFLRNWLIDHILDEDRGYVDCFISNGVNSG